MLMKVPGNETPALYERGPQSESNLYGNVRKANLAPLPEVILVVCASVSFLFVSHFLSPFKYNVFNIRLLKNIRSGSFLGDHCNRWIQILVPSLTSKIIRNY